MNLRITKDVHEPSPFKYFIIDTDIGGDDAQALIAAFNYAKKTGKELLGITCIDGNTTVENVVRNTLITMAICGVKYPVFKGADSGLMMENPKDYYFSEDGIGGKQQEYYEKYKDQIDESLVQDIPAYKFIAESAVKYKGELAIVALAPLTNIALAYHYENCLPDCVSQLVLLGTSDTLMGVHTFYASEFNIAVDPESANIVFNSFKEILVIPFDSFISSIDTEVTSHLFFDESTEKSKFVSDIYGIIKTKYPPSVCDPIAIICLFRPECILSGMKVRMEITLTGRRIRGASFIDWFSPQSSEHNVYLIQGVDLDIVNADILESYK